MTLHRILQKFDVAVCGFNVAESFLSLLIKSGSSPLHLQESETFTMSFENVYTYCIFHV